jgi:hypothetical protein
VTRSTVSTIAGDEMNNSEVNLRKNRFTKAITDKIGDCSKSTLRRHDITPDKDKDIYDDMYEIDLLDDDEIIFQDVDERGMPLERLDYDDIKLNDDVSVEAQDKYIGMRVPLSHRG